MTCPPLQSITHSGALVYALLLLHIDLLARPGLICCPFFSSGLNAPQDGTAAPALFSHDRGAVMIIRFAHSRCPNKNARKGSESGTEESGEQSQGFAERLF